MFEIGNSLREARLRQGLDLARAENDTKIRSKYLQALEDERFEVLPAETYVKGFLRTYAEYLGLDGQLYVDEFNSRFATAEEPIVASTPPRRRRQRASESSFVVVALAGIVAVTVLVVVAFAFNNGPSTADRAAELASDNAASAPTETDSEGIAGATTTEDPETTPAAPKTARLVLTAARGDCWAEVHAGSAAGELLFSGTILQGDTMRFTNKRIWVALGAPEALNVRLNGQPVELPAGETFVVTAQGVRAQA